MVPPIWRSPKTACRRFEAYGWHVQSVADGNDVEAIDAAIKAAKADPRPSLIAVRTIIGFGAPKKQGTSKAHGEPLGDEELNAAKENLGWPVEPRFLIPGDVLEFFREAVERGRELRNRLENASSRRTKRLHPELGAELQRRLDGELPDGWDADLPTFPVDAKGMATRVFFRKNVGCVGCEAS